MKISENSVFLSDFSFSSLPGFRDCESCSVQGRRVSLLRLSGIAVPCFGRTSFPAALFKSFLLQTASINSGRACLAPVLKKFRRGLGFQTFVINETQTSVQF